MRHRQSDTVANHDEHGRIACHSGNDAIKDVLKATEAGNAKEATTAFQAAVPKIDTMVNKGLIHRNKAARTKSRLNARIRGLSG